MIKNIKKINKTEIHMGDWITKFYLLNHRDLNVFHNYEKKLNYKVKPIDTGLS